MVPGIILTSADEALKKDFETIAQFFPKDRLIDIIRSLSTNKFNSYNQQYQLMLIDDNWIRPGNAKCKFKWVSYERLMEHDTTELINFLRLEYNTQYKNLLGYKLRYK